MKSFTNILCLLIVGIFFGFSQKSDAQQRKETDIFKPGSIVSFHSSAPLCFSKHLLKTLLEHIKNKNNAAIEALYKRQECVEVADENVKLNYFKIISIEPPYIEIVGIESKESHGLWSHMLFFKEPGN